ncbi:hypothetical protein, partial [Mesorhizobium japonicum]|uniref:hypothetical protein n=1 Tax=Mesorhizobium japonicum TaxID=2066070 RepID=UPI003B5A0D41
MTAYIHTDQNEDVTAKVSVHFQANQTTATTGLKILQDNVVADGVAENIVEVTMLDGKLNPVPDFKLSYTVEG